MEFTGIQDAVGKWVIIHFVDWPDQLKSPVTGLGDVEGRWLQFRLRAFDHLGVWLENPYFKVRADDSDDPARDDQRQEALRGPAIVLVKWQYIATVIFLEGQKMEDLRVGFPTS